MRISRFLTALMIAGVVLGGATACGKRPKSPSVPIAEIEALEGAKASVHLVNKKLRKRIASEIQDAKRLPDGRMATRVVLRNRTSKLLHVQTRTVFKDDQGISTGDETAWNDLYMDPLQMVTIDAESKTADVMRYTVEVRLPIKVRGKFPGT